MNTRDMIDGILNRLFDPSYMTALKNEYAAQTRDGTFFAEEAEYTAATQFLQEHLSPEKQTLLIQMEESYADTQHYASCHPFFCGLLCAFEQFFRPNSSPRYNYSTIVMERMCTMPYMKRHPLFYKQNTKILELTEALQNDADEETSGHITSINCAWDQRVHSATIYSFYIGYRTGLSIIDEVEPHASMALMDKLLYLEYELDYTIPYMFREQKEIVYAQHGTN